MAKCIHPNTAVRTAMSNPNGLLGQTSCHYLNQGRTFYDILMRSHIEWLTLTLAN